MVISLDLTAELIAALDKRLVKRPEPPVWPFEKKHLKFSRLSLKERKQLEEFQSAMRVYNDYPTIIKPERGSRSAVVEDLLRAGLNMPKINEKKKKPVKKTPTEAIAASKPSAENGVPSGTN